MAPGPARWQKVFLALVTPDRTPSPRLAVFASPSSTHPSGFYKIVSSIDINLSFPTDTYSIFAFCDEASCFALGAQADVGGHFSGHQIELDNPPFNFGHNHVDHSGEFRSDYARRAGFWNTVLLQMKLK